MTRITEPDWTPEQIMAIRKMFRANVRMKDVMINMKTKMSVKAFQSRCLKLGMRFDNKPGIHLGTSVLNRGDEYVS